MLAKITAWLSALPRELYIFVISMLPIIELRGAIPVGAALEMPFYLNYLIAVVGNLLPVPLILLFIPKFLDFLERFKLFRPMVQWLRKKADKNSGKIIKNTPDKIAEDAVTSADDAENLVDVSEKAEQEAPAKKGRMGKGVFAALILFVAVPLPGTGAWTGSLVAALFNLPRKQSFLAVTLGVMISGVVMCLASYGVVGFLKFLL